MIDSHGKRMLGGVGTLYGPAQNTQFDRVVQMVQESLTLAAESILADKIENEDGLNGRVSLFIAKLSRRAGLPYVAKHECMEDETKGNSPAVDIGVYLDIGDIAILPYKVAVFEGKRLSSNLGTNRQREYVYGHEKNGKHVSCGGIERFKLSIHGRDFSRAGMIGYIQNNGPVFWHGQVNSWVTELARQNHEPAWSDKEHLIMLGSEGRVTVSTSTVRRSDNEVNLTHLWVDLVPDN